ncbi:MAG: ROK family transcriptional regulator [Alphaproteobacteria bacterium]|jgi:predicted NBD/HSP70 family sugar kinase|nr:ROK family transcriptional regulator [Alphaproteobacteria bacterium]
MNTRSPAGQSPIGDHISTTLHGGNQVSVGQYNERLVISLLRRHGWLTKADLARMTGLSAQTMTVIVKRLIASELLLSGDKVRGRVGQPSTPFALNPLGAVSIGIKIGRRSLDLIAMGFDGTVLARRTERFALPDAAATLRLIDDNLPGLLEDLPAEQRTRILGAGVAMPRTLAGWESEMNLPAGALDDWNEVDIVAEVENRIGASTYLLHDVSAACLAELCFGRGKEIQNFLYLYVGSFVGGGLVLSNQLQTGARGAAAAIGSLPTGLCSAGIPPQLIEKASLTGFEALVRAAGREDPHSFYYGEQDATTVRVFAEWAEGAAQSLAFAITSTASILDLDAVILAGGLPEDRTADLLRMTGAALASYNSKGLHMPQLHQAEIGITARAIGSAFLPIYANFSLDRDSLLINM